MKNHFIFVESLKKLIYVEHMFDIAEKGWLEYVWKFEVQLYVEPPFFKDQNITFWSYNFKDFEWNFLGGVNN